MTETTKKTTTKKRASTVKGKQTINWMGFCRKEHYVLNKENAAIKKLISKAEVKSLSKKREQEILDSLEESDFSCKLLLLQFFKDIVHAAGYKSIKYVPLGQASQTYCSLACEIEFEDGRVSTGVADAHVSNSTSFTKYYCAAIAENRSFIRAVKQHFNIPVLGKDEIGETPSEDGGNLTPNGSSDVAGQPTPNTTLQSLVQKKLKIENFEDFKKFLKAEVKKAQEDDEPPIIKEDEYQDWAKYESFSDVKPMKALQLIAYIKSISKE